MCERGMSAPMGEIPSLPMDRRGMIGFNDLRFTELLKRLTLDLEQEIICEGGNPDVYVGC